MDSHNQDPERDLNTTQATNDAPHQDSAQTPTTPPPPADGQERPSALRPVDEDHFLNLVDHNRWQDIRAYLADLTPTDAANLIGQIPDDEKEKILVIFRLLNKDHAADIFTYLNQDLHQYIISSIANADINDLIRRISVDDAVDILEELPTNMVRMILSAAPPDKRSLINRALSYPENSAGSIMTVEYISLFEDMTVESALAHIRRHGTDRETIYTAYVTDPRRKLVGAVSLRKILLAPNNFLIRDIMALQVKHVHTLDDQEEVAHDFQDYDLNVMPVVDNEDRLVGIITIDDIVDVIEAENTEDFEKMAALHPSEGEYLKTGVFQLARNRIGWLTFLMISASFTGAVITHFEHLLASAAVLAAFIPMLMGTGGNCGSQAVTLVIRGMAVGDIELRQWPSVFWHELRIGAIVGLALAAVNFLYMHFFPSSLNYGDIPRIKVELIVSATILCTVIFAKLIGCTLPMAAKRLRFDPATMAAPMLSTIVDPVTLVIFFTIAQTLLHLTA